VTNATDKGTTQSFKLKAISSKIFWKIGIYITLNVNKNVQVTPTTSNLFVKIPAFSIGSSKDLKENGTNSIMLTMVANVSVLAFSMLPVAMPAEAKTQILIKQYLKGSESLQ